MAEEGFKRKLAAILSEYAEDKSRLVDDNEESKILTLKSYHSGAAERIRPP
jgi:hypothetical protein